MQEVRVVRTPMPEYREVYSPAQPEMRYIQEPMPPATRERIVVDQYGRRFREIISEPLLPPPPVPRATSYAPSDMLRQAQQYESPRAGSVMVEERPRQRYEQDMPPPPPILRQAPETPVKAPGQGMRETYGSLSGGRGGLQQAYDSQPNTRPSTAQVYERSQPSLYNGQDDYRTPVRMSSVRPAPQYEEVMQVLPRAENVRAARREGSVYTDDRGAPRELVTIEQSRQPRYRIIESDMQAPPPGQPRYVDAHGRELMPIQQDGDVRYVQRYQ